MKYKIGELARLSGYSPESIRHYEHLGILSLPERSSSGQRLYSEEHLTVLKAIKTYRRADFGLSDIGNLLAEIRTPKFCDTIEALYKKYEMILAEKKAELAASERALKSMKTKCENCELRHTHLSGKDCIVGEDAEKEMSTCMSKIKLP